MPTYFISGHLDLTAEEFITHYVPYLEAAVGRGATFVVGDARGCDTLAQAWLASKGAVATVFHMFEAPRNCLSDFPKRGGFATDDERDAAMTRETHFDIAWVRKGRWNSGTARNLARRVYNWTGGEFYCESGTEDCALGPKHVCALHMAVLYNDLFGYLPSPGGP